MLTFHLPTLGATAVTELEGIVVPTVALKVASEIKFKKKLAVTELEGIVVPTVALKVAYGMYICICHMCMCMHIYVCVCV